MQRVRYSQAKAAKLAAVHERLTDAYGPMPWKRRGSGLDVLVAMMLSQNTSSANAREGFRRLKRDLPTWEEVLAAPVGQIQSLIGVCGLGRMRAWRLLAILRRIKKERGKLSLAHVSRMSRDEAIAYLDSFHGIGPKTIACTLLFAYSFAIFPVDNGILRVLRRTGIVRPKAKDVEAAAVVERHVDGGDRHALHKLIYRLAKLHCKPRNPDCRDCPLLDLCPTGQRRIKHKPVQTDPPPKRAKQKTTLAAWASAGMRNEED